eukprot:TRINITY_DN53073_c0_g1_i1.p3 TRINITY_DN53073_c0_g1~~TRINITY_DN53073_c0_g1_i1.p3  ORF type:complete len:109 (-),score=39.41 TRINITY_DN53073_c0_g1_i1:1384-1710(-)
MKVIAAYLLLQLAGKTPDAKSIEKVLKAGGVSADNDKIKALIAAVGDSDVEELITEGVGKMGSLGAASGGAAAPAAGGGGGGGAAPAKEEKKKEESEEDDDMGFGLFD